MFGLTTVNQALEQLEIKRFGSFSIHPDSSIITSTFIKDSSHLVYSCPLIFKCEMLSNFQHAELMIKPFVFPNPTTGTIYIKWINLNENNQSINLYSSTGSLIKSFPILNHFAEEIELDVSSIPKGVYFLQLNSSFQKLIIL